MKTQGVIFDIKKYSIHDGPGIRTTVFLKGCPLSCWWCHNPESQHPEPETMALSRREMLADSASGRTDATVGRVTTVDEVIREIEKDAPFYDTSSGGATFSGGEPLAQSDFLCALLSACREREIHTAVDTSGFAPREVVESVRLLTDLFLYDLKLMDDTAHIRHTGVPVNPILENLKYLAEQDTQIHIRIPVIPGITDSEENFIRIAEFLSDIPTVKQIGLLPYNRLGDEKIRRLGRTNPMNGAESPSDNHMQSIQALFEERGYKVRIGG